MLASARTLARRTWTFGLVFLAALCTATPAMAMDQCRRGSGQVDRWPFFLGTGLTVALILVYLVLLRTAPGKPTRHGARLAVVLLALFSSCGACSTLTCGVLFCPRNTQAPEVVCDQLETIARRSEGPVGFDHAACLTTWRQEQEDRSSWSYRELSGCVVGLDFLWIGTDACKEEGFELARHAPGQWPASSGEEPPLPPAQQPSPP